MKTMRTFGEGDYAISLDITNDVARHRNGVGGEGFFVVRFTVAKETGTFLATVFDPELDEHEGYTNALVAVINLDLLPNISWGNKWRGDGFRDPLVAAIRAFQQWEDRALDARIAEAEQRNKGGKQ